MQDDDKKHKDQFDAALPLPVSASPKASKNDTGKPETSAAADLIRKKVEAAYANAPDAKLEGRDIKSSDADELSRHQRFIMELTNSGKPLHEVQMAWHEYYAGLPDEQKHEVWQEFYNTHEQASRYHAATAHRKSGSEAAETNPPLPAQLREPYSASRTIQNFRKSLRSPRPTSPRSAPHSPVRSLLFGFGIGCLVLIVFLFSFFNERFITPFIQPSRDASATPLITSTQPVSKSPELIIPKVNVQIPIVFARDNSDNTIETDLESGVVHYAYTAMPGQNGNLVIFGHSSNNIFNPGKYKFAFVLLKRLDSGDTFYIDYHSQRYTYEVFNKKIVPPNDVGVLDTVDSKPATATLITCDPPGTSINRLVVSAEQIDPSPGGNKAASKTDEKAIAQTTAIAGNGPTLWQRFIHWLWD